MTAFKHGCWPSLCGQGRACAPGALDSVDLCIHILASGIIRVLHILAFHPALPLQAHYIRSM